MTPRGEVWPAEGSSPAPLPSHEADWTEEARHEATRRAVAAEQKADGMQEMSDILSKCTPEQLESILSAARRIVDLSTDTSGVQNG